MRKFYQVLFTILAITHAQRIQAQISGLVFKDYNANALRDSASKLLEPRYQGITVTAYDNNGIAIASTVSGIDGTYSFTASQIPANQKVRLEFTGYPSGTYPTVAGGTSVQFVTSGPSATNINFAFGSPDDYCQANPLVISTHNSVGPATGSNSGLEGVYYDKPSFTSPGTEIGFSTNSAIGTTYGLAYARRNKTLYASAVVRNYFGTGPGGFDAIYPFTFLDVNDSASPAPTLTQGTTIDLGTLGVSVGTDPRTGPITGSNPYTDNATLYQKVGKIGIGDIDVDANGDTLYAVNMNDGAPTLAILNVANPTSPSLLADVPMPNPGCSNGVFRPWAVKVYQGKAYIGGVCDASTGTAANLSAYVYRYDGGTSFTQVATMPLNYTRGKNTFRSNGTFTSADWLPWTNTWTPELLSLGPDIASQPQPMLVDIEFTEDGSMILGFADRFTYQTAHGQRRYGVTSGSTYFTSPGSGDIIKFCNINGTLVLETAIGGCLQNNTDNGSVTSANKINAPTGVKEYFDDDYYNTGSSSSGQAGHSECALGSLALLPGSNQVLTSNYDPTTTIVPGGTSGPVNTSGIRTYNSQTGNYVKGWTMTTENEPGSNRKGGNMGDIEVMCNPAPIEIGNRVWLDSNFNGIQDPNEPGIAGVLLELVDAMGNPVDSDPLTTGIQPTFVTTDANGNWLLTTITGTDVTGKNYGVNLLPKTNYKVRVATSGTGSDWSSGSSTGTGNLAGLQLTKTNSTGSGAPDISDNDATQGNSPEINVFIESIGANNHTFDMGFTTFGSIGNYVWLDLDDNGLQNEPAIDGINGEKLFLINADTGNIIDSTVTANNPINGNPGYYLFDSLITGNYIVKFPTHFGTAVLTTTGSGTTVDGNSNANSVSGESEIIPINAFGTGTDKNNMTVDAGYADFGSLGNYVWRDLNADGLQNEAPSEGINGQKVYLINATTNAIIDSTITADNPVTGNPGFYIFDHLVSGDYKVKFPTSIGTGSLTAQGTGTTVDGNSNADLTSGESETITIDAFGTGVAKDNMTVDAGYVAFGSIGNYVWKDDNDDGLQNEPASEGYDGITVYLIDVNTGNIIDSTITASLSGQPGYYLFDSLNSGNYQVQFPTNIGPAVITITGTGLTTDGNSNANSVSGLSESIPIDAYGTGVEKDNMTVDAGYASFGSIGNHIWNDLNGNGIFDEPGSEGINGETVYLLNGITNAIIDSTTTDNNPVTGEPGYYIFDHLVSGDYRVQFPTNVNNAVLTAQGSGTTVDSNSNANVITGLSEVINIDAFGLGIARDNMTVDAGYVVLATIGNYVWYDNNKNGIQDSLINPINGTKIGEELPVSDVIVQLYTAGNVLYATDTTDASGMYLFEDLPLGSYYVQFVGSSLPPNFVVTMPNAGSNDSLDSDVNTTTLQTMITELTPGEVDLRWDMGIYIKDTLQIIDSCTCHNIEYYTSETKEVLESLSITGTPGATWILVGQTGMKLIDTIFNPLMPLNTVLQEVTPGNYQLKFASQVGDGFTAKVTNGTDTLNIGSICYGINKGIINIPDTIECSFPAITTLMGGATYVNNIGTFPALGTASFYILDDNDNEIPITQLDKSIYGPADTTIEIHMDFASSDPQFCDLEASKLVYIKYEECQLYGSIGNYVWYDVNNNGIQDEDSSYGINGLTIYLLDNGGNVIDSTITDIDSLNRPGYYLFDSLLTGNYQIQFPLNAFGNPLSTTVDQGTELDFNNDADAAGLSAIIPIDVFQSGFDKNNPTIDAGYTLPVYGSIGNYVWVDSNYNGLNDEDPSAGVPNVKVYLLDNFNAVIDSTTTDGSGYYLFDSLSSGDYKVLFPPTALPDFDLTDQTPTLQTDSNSDANIMTGMSPTVTINTAETGQNKDNTTIDAGYTQYGSLGSYVWVDNDSNGIFNEPPSAGIPGVTVYLLDSTLTVIDSTVTDSTGFYQFTRLPSGNYQVQFPTNILGGLTIQDGTPNTSNNSDPDVSSGLSPIIPINGFGIGTSRNNPTIYAGYYPGVPFSVDGIKIVAIKNELNNTIQWSGINPKDIVSYKLYKGTNANDLKVIAEQSANVNNVYQYVDQNLVNGKVYYMVEANSSNGQINNSKLVSVQRSNVAQISAYPNPVIEEVQINIDYLAQNQNASIILRDMNGKLMHRVEVEVVANITNHVTIDMSNLANGQYIIEVRIQGETKLMRVQKMK